MYLTKTHSIPIKRQIS